MLRVIYVLTVLGASFAWSPISLTSSSMNLNRHLTKGRIGGAITGSISNVATIKRKCGSMRGRNSLGMGVLDDIKKIIAGGDPSEVLAAENDEIINSYMTIVSKVNALEENYEALSDEDLKAKTEHFKEEIKRGASLDSLLVEAFAVVS